MATSLKLLSQRSRLYTILFLIICFCIWEAFGFMIVSKRDVASNQAESGVTESETRVQADKTDLNDSGENTDGISRLYCVDGDCTCKAMGCYQCSEEKEESRTSVLKYLCASEKSYQRFECEGSEISKYASCHSEKLRPFRTVEELRFLKFEVFCLMLSILSYAVVWTRSKVGERIVIKRIQKLTEDPIS